MKVLEAMALGIPVVTTPAGAEGIVAPAGHGLVVAAADRFGRALAGLLGSPERRAETGRLGRAAMLEAHAPVPAARARVAALSAAFGDQP
jgi:glycosyltransferase involved in cell wall biosynthesis